MAKQSTNDVCGGVILAVLLMAMVGIVGHAFYDFAYQRGVNHGRAVGARSALREAALYRAGEFRFDTVTGATAWFWRYDLLPRDDSQIAWKASSIDLDE